MLPDFFSAASIDIGAAGVMLRTARHPRAPYALLSQ